MLVTTLKTFLLDYLAIFFDLDTMHWVGDSKIFLISILNFFIRKRISDRTAILAWSKYFLSY